jgi:hypothetical protein
MCDYYGDPTRHCTCSSTMVTRYQKRISGPLMDRIDIHMQVPRVEYQKLRDMRPGETSAAVRARGEAVGILTCKISGLSRPAQFIDKAAFCMYNGIIIIVTQ